MRNAPREQGYTLVEILVVLAILSLVAALAMPPAAHTVESVFLQTDARAVAAALRDARRAAAARAVTIVLRTSAQGLEDNTGREIALPHGSHIVLDEPELRFFADGTTDGGTLRVVRDERSLLIRVAWLTGDISIPEAP